MSQGSPGETGRPSVSSDLGHRLTKWLLLTGPRWLVAGGILVGIGVLITGLLLAGVVSVQDDGPLTRGFAALVGGNLTLITIVISINQLVVSQEFGTPGELQEEIEEMMDYRRQAERTADAAVSPITPYAFLSFLVGAMRKNALQLQETVADAEDLDDDVREEIERFADTLLGQADRTVVGPDQTPTDAFPALLTILEVDFTGDLHEARRLQTAHGDVLSPETSHTLEELRRLFEYIGVLRQYLETLYLQRELATFSRRLFVVGIPAVIASFLTIWLYGDPVGTTLVGLPLQGAVTVASIVACAPLSYFFAYVLRLSTITRQTAALIPFKSSEGSLG